MIIKTAEQIYKCCTARKAEKVATQPNVCHKPNRDGCVCACCMSACSAFSRVTSYTTHLFLDLVSLVLQLQCILFSCSTGSLR